MDHAVSGSMATAIKVSLMRRCTSEQDEVDTSSSSLCRYADTDLPFDVRPKIGFRSVLAPSLQAEVDFFGRQFWRPAEQIAH